MHVRNKLFRQIYAFFFLFKKQIAFSCLFPHSIRTFISSMPCLLDFNEAKQVKIVWQRINVFCFARTHFFTHIFAKWHDIFIPTSRYTPYLKNLLGCPTFVKLDFWKVLCGWAGA